MNNRKVINISHYNSSLHFLCWLKESLRQASKKELVHFFEREQTSPKVTEAKERALCGGGKKSFPSRRPAGGTTQSTMQANAEAKRAWTMLSCEEKKMRSILTYSIVLSPQPCYGRRIFSFTPHVAFTSLQPTTGTSDIFYYHTNHLGSTAFVTDQNQNVTQGFLYAPFGEITTEYNSTFGSDIIPKYSFNAKELDEETGMYYYEARYYKPPVFTSRDPMFEKYFWMTPYAYCANNPVKYVDPSGKTVVLTGVNSDSNQSAFESVQQGTNLTLWYENNILYCNGNILNDYDQQLYNAITDKNVIVEIEVVTSNVNYVFGKTEDGIDMSFIPINGHCLGAHYYNIDLELFTFGLVHDSYSFSCAKNVIYLDGLKSMEKKGAEGSGIIHEITEAYRFGLRALQLKTDLPPVIKTQEEIDNPLSYYNTEYMRHHNGATPAPNEMNDKQSLNYKSPQRKYLRRMGKR